MTKLHYNPLFILWHILRNDIHKLEYDPRTQWRFHLWMTRYWACNIPIVCFMFFFLPKIWVALALFINTIYSLYANLATDFGAVPGSYAAMKADEIQQAQVGQTPSSVSAPYASEAMANFTD